MSYKVTCPSCEAVVESAFVRVGAVTRCGSCGMRYAVREQDITRPGKPTPGPLAPVVAERRASDEAAAPGLSGLSDLMKRQDQVHAHTAADPPPVARQRADAVVEDDVIDLGQASPAPRRSAAVVRARARKKKQQMQTGLIAAAAACMVVGVILLIVLLISGTGTQPVHNPLAADPQPAAPTPPADPADPVTVVDQDPTDPVDPPPPVDPPTPEPVDPPTPAGPPAIAAQPIQATAWQEVQPPAAPPAGAPDPIRVTGVTVDAGQVIVTVTSDTLETIDLAAVQCHQLDSAGQAVRTAQSPVLMLESLESTTLRFPIPVGTPEDTTFTATAAVQRTARQVFPVEAVNVTPDPAVSPADGARLRIEVPGRIDTRARRLVVFVEALDGAQNSLGVWRVEHGGDDIVAGLRTCTARIDTPLPDPVTWTATAHALR